MSTTTMTMRDRGDRYGPMEWAQQEVFEKCWAHSPREPPHAHSAGVATGTVARCLRIDVHDDNDNA